MTLGRPSNRALLWLAVAAYAAGFSALSILRHRAFSTGRFDLGNMVQAVWSTAHGHPLQITGLRGDQISRLGAHFDPILAAFAPLWLVWPSADMLLVAQAVAVAVGALPVFWLARKHLDSERAGARLRARVPDLPADPVADVERVPPGRACMPAAAVRDLVPGRRPAPAVRGVRPGRGDDEGGDRARRRGPRHLVRARPRPPPDRSSRRRRRSRDRASGDRGRDPALQPRGHVQLLHALQPGRQLARRDRAHRAHRSLEDRHDRLHRPRTRLRRPPRAPARPARRPRPARADRRRARTRGQPPLGSDHSDLDPLPLHRRTDPRARRGCGLRRQAPAAARPGCKPRGGRRCGLELPARPGAALALLPRRRAAAGARRRRSASTTGSQLGRCG